MLKMKFLIVAFITVFAFNDFVLANASEKGDPSKGKEIFAGKCAPCHGQRGHGDGPGAASLQPKPRNLSDAKYISALNDDLMFQAIHEGGASMGKSPAMPSWKFSLSESDIWNVIAYVRKDICKCEYNGAKKANQ